MAGLSGNVKLRGERRRTGRGCSYERRRLSVGEGGTVAEDLEQHRPQAEDVGLRANRVAACLLG